MVIEQITRIRGRPASVTPFILGHLAIVGEDYPANIHRAYKQHLVEMSLNNGRCYTNDNGKICGKPYHKPVYHSMEMAIQRLAREGLIEFSGREEESDNPQFINWEVKPLRRYYRLKRSQNGVK